MKYLRPILPELLMVAIMAAIALAYMSPVFEGKTLPQGDVIHAKDQIVDVQEFQEETGEYPGWTNSAFGGMPTYQLKSPPSRNIFHYLFRILKLYLPGYTAAILFIAMLGFYFLLRTLKLNRWLAIGGAVAFALSSHHLQLIATGHVNKIYAIALMAPVIAGMLMVFKRKYLAGGILTTIGLGVQITLNHVQVTYYLGMMIAVYILVELVYAIREKYFSHFVKSSLILLAALILALLPNMTMLLTTYEYAQETTRGKTVLVDEEGESDGGLNLDYMTEWSYGVGETLNLFIPNLYGGGGSSVTLGPDSEFFLELQRRRIQNAQQYAAQAPIYWGSQPFTAGPHYVGAIIVFLAVLGLLLIRGPKRWWMLIVIILSVMLAWGKNFMGLTEFFANNVPLYNKFRDMTNMLIIAQFALPFLAFLGIRSWFYDDKRSPEEKLKKLYIATGISGGIALIFALMPSMFLSFTGPQDSLYESSLPMDALRLDRIGIARKDAFRTLVFVVLASGILWASLKMKFKKVYLFAGLSILILIDLWAVDRRYLKTDNFVEKSRLEQSIAATPADNFILQDTETGFRVLDISGPSPQNPNPFKYSRTSRFHRSLGGYHGAKLGRIQDLIDRNLFPEMQAFLGSFGPEATLQSVTGAMSSMNAYNMLNTKYIILNTQQQPLSNPNAMGPAWFAENIRTAKDANEEIALISDIDLRTTSIVNAEFETAIGDVQHGDPGFTNEKIDLLEIQPNYLKYAAKAGKKRLAVFSEIWYPHGWKAFIDGEESEIIRANYLLRALPVPEGEHVIEFRFDPKSLKTGQSIALIGSIIILLVILGWIFTDRKNLLKILKSED